METELRTEGATLGRYRINVAQYLKMIDAGIFSDGTRVELLGGVLAKKMTKNVPHDFAVMQLAEIVRRILPPPWIVREEKSIVMGSRWRPEPDLVVLGGPTTAYRSRDPNPADIALLIEVADSSYPSDRGIKWRGYASAKIPAYWVVNIAESRVEVYTDPDGSGRSAAYRRLSLFGRDEEILVLIEGLEAGRVSVRDVLPAAGPGGGD